MAKGKNLNPADAHRKALRKKELKKNKTERQKNRDFALVKKDTGEIDDEIAELEKVTEQTSAQKARIAELKAELVRITKKKEEYVEAHPEQRGLVYRRRGGREKEGEDEEEKASRPPAKTKRNIFNKNGLPRHPERSVYFDPIMNPYGMPPPGMPYVERALLPGEIDSEAEEDNGSDNGDDSDDDIAMPEGPPPGGESGGAESDDDDIPMPEGPPPTRSDEGLSPSLPPLPPGPPPHTSDLPPPMPPFAPNLYPQMIHQAGPSFLPPMHLMGAPPFPPHGFPPPPPPPGFATNNLPPPPPGFYPRRAQSTSAMQDPLSAIPHQTYQAHRETRQGPTSTPAASSPSSLPHNPNLPPRPPASGITSRSEDATVSAAPQLRDFKKESTAFLPAALKRKKGAGGTGASGRINAAPSLGTDASGTGVDTDASPSAVQPKPDLLGMLKEKFGPMSGASAGDAVEGDAGVKRRKLEMDAGANSKPKDDYGKFLAEMGDILGPAP
ncbi:WW domain binding protein 11-domain-containing protein [Phellopilus nigrolimitatus]|nr:WW domain binding protein 11-domain-containing protein [Phellopilus nigrolimitatus]